MAITEARLFPTPDEHIAHLPQEDISLIDSQAQSTIPESSTLIYSSSRPINAIDLANKLAARGIPLHDSSTPVSKDAKHTRLTPQRVIWGAVGATALTAATIIYSHMPTSSGDTITQIQPIIDDEPHTAILPIVEVEQPSIEDEQYLAMTKNAFQIAFGDKIHPVNPSQPQSLEWPDAATFARTKKTDTSRTSNKNIWIMHINTPSTANQKPMLTTVASRSGSKPLEPQNIESFSILTVANTLFPELKSVAEVEAAFNQLYADANSYDLETTDDEGFIETIGVRQIDEITNAKVSIDSNRTVSVVITYQK